MLTNDVPYIHVYAIFGQKKKLGSSACVFLIYMHLSKSYTNKIPLENSRRRYREKKGTLYAIFKK